MKIADKRERLAELIYSRLVVEDRPDSPAGEDENWYLSCWREAMVAALAVYPGQTGLGPDSFVDAGRESAKVLDEAEAKKGPLTRAGEKWQNLFGEWIDG